ncbi:hypothetical protein KP509_1Z323100 [Ceratopteris richardii]|nr:hypothetical protein KP509_1Z323100 [Ceratopteris richardii]
MHRHMHACTLSLECLACMCAYIHLHAIMHKGAHIKMRSYNRVIWYLSSVIYNNL